MKRLLFISVICLVFSAATKAQMDTMKKVPLISAEQYLQKSKRQKTIASVMAISGTVIVITAVFGISQEENYSGYSISTEGLKTALTVTGIVSLGGSIPLFIAASKNKGKALSASIGLKLEKATVASPFSFTRHSYPALSINIKL